jgi:Icc-related predicted phosphoesterase
VYKADVLVMGGDITGKMIVPVVEQADGSFEFEFLGTRRHAADAAEMDEIEKVIRRSGSYAYRTDAERFGALGQSGDRAVAVEGIALELMLERVQQWVRLAEERLGGTGTPLLMGCGNDDPYEVDDILRASDVITAHDNRVVRIDQHHEMIGLGYANQTPWECPRDIPEAEIAERVEAVAAQVTDMANAVFCVHVPPVDSQLDTCPRLDTSSYPPQVMLDATGQPVPHGAGSTAVREAIERHQPLLGLHGHIHESRAVAKLGRTQVMNPGSEYGEGVLRGVIVNLTEDAVLSHQFTSG